MSYQRFAAALLAVLAAALLTQCSDPKPVDPTPECDPATDPACAPEEEGCLTDRDCGDPSVFMCNKAGDCVPACTLASQCAAHPAANGGPLPGCAGGLGCVCDARKCVPQACASDLECLAPGTLCKSGQCVAADADADRCEITPEYSVLRTGQTVRFTAVAYKANVPVRLGEGGLTWAVAPGAEGYVQMDGPGSFTVLTQIASTPIDLVQVTPRGGTACKARATIYGEPPPGQARVVVVDEMTGRPVANAYVLYQDQPMVSAAIGVHVIDNAPQPPAGGATVSVFHADYQYVTIVGIAGRDLFVPIRRNPEQKAGGYKGQFQGMPTDQVVAVGIAGTSMPGSLIDLDYNTLLGKMEKVDISYSGQSFDDVELPSGIELAVGTQKFKGDHKALGVPGVCVGTDAETKMAAGDCGTRTAWGLMGSVPIGKLLDILADQRAGAEISASQVVSIIVPEMTSFKSSVKRDLSFQLAVAPDGDPTTLYPNDELFVPYNPAPQIGLTLKSKVALPDLPSAHGTRLGTALMLGGSMVPGRGFVVLGLSGGTDADETYPTPNGKVNGIDVGSDGNKVVTDDGVLTLRHAPAHGGLEGTKYTVVAMAAPAELNMPNGAVATTGLVKFADDLRYGTNLSFDGEFLGFSESGKYDFRAGQFTGATVAPNALNRVVFMSKGNKRWIVYFKASSFAVPPVPQVAGLEDRTMNDGVDRNPAVSPDGRRASISQQVLRAADSTGPVDLEKLFGFGKVGLGLVELTNGFSNYTADLTVKFEGVPAAIAATTPLKVQVTGLDVPAQGYLEIYADAPTTKVEIRQLNEKWEGTAAFDAGALTPGAHTLTVRMMNLDGTPMDPKVESKLAVTVQ